MSLLRSIAFTALVLSAAVYAPQTFAAAEPEHLQSTEKDRTHLELTVFNNNFAFIRDVRILDLKAGTGALEFTGIPGTVIPDTILLRGLGDKKGFTVLEQSFHYDPPVEKTLLDKYVGKKIRLEMWNRFNDRVSSVEATLLSNSSGPVYKIGDEIYIGHPGIRVLPRMPEGLVIRPKISWLYSAEEKGAYELEAGYLAENIKWKALYQLVLKGKREKLKGRLAGWVSLSNKSGTAFKDAELRFAAGTPHRSAQAYGTAPGRALGGAYKVMRSESADLSESPVFEYHIYDLGRKIDIQNNEQKQFSLIKPREIKVSKEFEIRGYGGYYTRPLRGEKKQEPVNVYVKFKNSRPNHLGIPLAAGKMGIYTEDGGKGLEFVGEDNIGQTPKGNEVRLNAGLAFDITAKRRQKEYRRISSVLYDTAWEIRLKNNKSEGVSVNIVEPLPGSWSITSSSHPYTKVDAFTVKFKVKVPAGKEVIVTYGARVEL